MDLVKLCHLSLSTEVFSLLRNAILVRSTLGMARPLHSRAYFSTVVDWDRGSREDWLVG